MLYVVCPSCGTLLGNLQIPFEKDMKALCEEFGVDHESLSQGTLRDNKEFAERKKQIVERYIDPKRICCKMRLTNFCDIVQIIV
jgi:hypothetical protein